MKRCYICEAAVPPREQNKAFPFCSARCQTIDLGNWLTGDYRIPAETQSSEDDDRAPAADPTRP